MKSSGLCTKHENETIVYTTCRANCGGNCQCVIKAHVRDGKVVAVEPDDRYNRNVGREDAVLSEEDLIKTKLQRRPCVMGLAFHKYISHPDRILYPLKRVSGTQRGEGLVVAAFKKDAQLARPQREFCGCRPVIHVQGMNVALSQGAEAFSHHAVVGAQSWTALDGRARAPLPTGGFDFDQFFHGGG